MENAEFQHQGEVLWQGSGVRIFLQGERVYAEPLPTEKPLWKGSGSRVVFEQGMMVRRFTHSENRIWKEARMICEKKDWLIVLPFFDQSKSQDEALFPWAYIRGTDNRILTVKNQRFLAVSVPNGGGLFLPDRLFIHWRSIGLIGGHDPKTYHSDDGKLVHIPVQRGGYTVVRQEHELINRKYDAGEIGVGSLPSGSTTWYVESLLWDYEESPHDETIQQNLARALGMDVKSIVNRIIRQFPRHAGFRDDLFSYGMGELFTR